MKRNTQSNNNPAHGNSVFAILRFTLCACTLLAAAGAGAQQIGVNINGNPVDFPGIGPQQVNGRTLVPVRGVLEKIGARVTWIPSSQTVIASGHGTDIELHTGDRRATVNGRRVFLDVPAQQIAGHTMVPLRFIGEALGADVGWNEQEQLVSIETRDRGREPVYHRRPGDPVQQDRQSNPNRDNNRGRRLPNGDGSPNR